MLNEITVTTRKGMACSVIKKVAFTLLLFFFTGSLLLAGQEARFMKYPDIYKNKIVFTYEGDLWLANSDGTNAKRITNFPGAN